MTPLPGLQPHRLRRGLSRADLAKLAGLACETVRRLEQPGGRNWASPHTIRVLAEALGVEAAALTGRVELPVARLWAATRAALLDWRREG